MKTPYSKNSQRIAAAAPSPAQVRASVQAGGPPRRRRATPGGGAEQGPVPEVAGVVEPADRVVEVGGVPGDVHEEGQRHEEVDVPREGPAPPAQRPDERDEHDGRGVGGDADAHGLVREPVPFREHDDECEERGERRLGCEGERAPAGGFHARSLAAGGVPPHGREYSDSPE
ncbi:hypothetical protein LUX57_22230 [Actinomadura madurae]|uniref:hypothetical protein n=1 Tax=Actinomadura madurae TaxID=1993 RepID=UPI0020D24B2B|nr:hypothetical protein [Actinomadura madurae]MCP9967502.1 hypothetical protein [Actinomadura madurae]